MNVRLEKKLIDWFFEEALLFRHWSEIFLFLKYLHNRLGKNWQERGKWVKMANTTWSSQEINSPHPKWKEGVKGSQNVVSFSFLGRNVQTWSIRHIHMKVITLYDAIIRSAFFHPVKGQTNDTIILWPLHCQSWQFHIGICSKMYALIFCRFAVFHISPFSAQFSSLCLVDFMCGTVSLCAYRALYINNQKNRRQCKFNCNTVSNTLSCIPNKLRWATDRFFNFNEIVSRSGQKPWISLGFANFYPRTCTINEYSLCSGSDILSVARDMPSYSSQSHCADDVPSFPPPPFVSFLFAM